MPLVQPAFGKCGPPGVWWLDTSGGSQHTRKEQRRPKNHGSGKCGTLRVHGENAGRGWTKGKYRDRALAWAAPYNSSGCGEIAGHDLRHLIQLPLEVVELIVRGVGEGRRAGGASQTQVSGRAPIQDRGMDQSSGPVPSLQTRADHQKCHLNVDNRFLEIANPCFKENAWRQRM